MKCWNPTFQCTRFECNYSSCTCRSSENLCSSSEGAKERARGWRQDKLSLAYHKNWWFSEFHPPLMLMYSFVLYLLWWGLLTSPTRVLFAQSSQTSSLFMVLSHDDFFHFNFFFSSFPFIYHPPLVLRNENMHTHMHMCFVYG
jgi:hypothetical protein